MREDYDRGGSDRKVSSRSPPVSRAMFHSVAVVSFRGTRDFVGGAEAHGSISSNSFGKAVRDTACGRGVQRKVVNRDHNQAGPSVTAIGFIFLPTKPLPVGEWPPISALRTSDKLSRF